MAEDKNRSGMAVASMILGIAAIILGWIPIIGWLIILVGIGLGIAALVKISKDKNLGGKGMAIAGLVLCGVSILLNVLIAIGLMAFFHSVSSGAYMTP